MFYGDRTIVAAVNLSLAPGEWLSLIGANGSGKSTLLRLLSRILQPEAGNVSCCDGHDIHTPTVPRVAALLALLPQQHPCRLTSRCINSSAWAAPPINPGGSGI
ncbi:ATP-binding cassette domain-containing protein [Halomicronema hongdechloris]|uniref:ATP-binding cassette domain-containing protein n=1 Tax=Halomicronema hongdechloris TaxID=1209493 RepID=UPI00211AC433